MHTLRIRPLVKHRAIRIQPNLNPHGQTQRLPGQTLKKQLLRHAPPHPRPSPLHRQVMRIILVHLNLRVHKSLLRHFLALKIVDKGNRFVMVQVFAGVDVFRHQNAQRNQRGADGDVDAPPSQNARVVVFGEQDSGFFVLRVAHDGPSFG